MSSAATPSDPRLDPRLVPEKTAIVLIDLQNDIIRNDQGPFYGAIYKQVTERGIVAKAVDLVQAARTHGCPVFFVTVVRRPDYHDVVNQLTDLVQAAKAVPAKQQRALIAGTRGAELVDELQPTDADYVLVKKRRNAFLGTELDFHLRCRGVTTVVVGGVATDLGVENTVRDAWDRDYNVVVVEDLCTAVPLAAHDYAIQSVFPRMARVMKTAQVVQALAAG
jgi:nicotinamidase-related amidase